MKKPNPIAKITAHFHLPKLLTANNIELSQAERDKVASQTEIERQWYGDVDSFQNTAQILSAAHLGRLESVSPSPDYLPIMRLRNPKLIGEYPAYLTPNAKYLLDEIAEQWRLQAQGQNFSTDIRLSVTSLLRTQPYQELIVKAGKLAMLNSPHTRGEAFDIDASGYYFGETPINARQQRQKEWTQTFEEMGAALPSPKFGDYDQFNPTVVTILKSVLDQFKQSGKLNYVHEYAGTTNACLHICRHPQYQPKSKTDKITTTSHD